MDLSAESLVLLNWVSDLAGKARRDRPVGNREAKLEAVRASTRHDLSAGDIDRTLGEIGVQVVRPRGAAGAPP